MKHANRKDEEKLINTQYSSHKAKKKTKNKWLHGGGAKIGWEEWKNTETIKNSSSTFVEYKKK